jgi:hypothetical protein
MAISSKNRQFPSKSHHRRLKDLRLGHSNAVRMKRSKTNVTHTMCIISSYSLQKAISLCSRRLPELAILCQNDGLRCCPVRKPIGNQQVMPTVPTPVVSMKCSARSKRPTWSKTRNKNRYGPQKAVLSPQPEPSNGSCSQHGVYLKWHDNDAVNNKCSSSNANPPSSRQQKQVRCQYASRMGGFTSFRKSKTVPRRHSYPRTFEYKMFRPFKC